MKKILLLLAVLLLLSGCSVEQTSFANSLKGRVEEALPLLQEAVAHMEAFGEERIYVALEPFAENEGEEATERLVRFVKESDEREVLEDEVLDEVIRRFGLVRIYFQTSSDHRRSVIFSLGKEADKGIVSGFYYSYDGEPCPWWGRRAELVKKDGAWLQINQNGSAWYRTLLLTPSFYYFERHGSVLG